MENKRQKQQIIKALIFIKKIRAVYKRKYLRQLQQKLGRVDFNFQRKLLVYENISRGIKLDESSPVQLPYRRVKVDPYYIRGKIQYLESSIQKLCSQKPRQQNNTLTNHYLEQVSWAMKNMNQQNRNSQNLRTNNKPQKTSLKSQEASTFHKSKANLKNKYKKDWEQFAIPQQNETQSHKSTKLCEKPKQMITIFSPKPYKRLEFGSNYK